MTATTTRDKNAGRAPAPAPLPPARGLPTRRSRPALWLAGILAVIVCALGAAALVRSVGSTHPYLAIARPVAIGAKIVPEDLTVVEINAAPGLTPVAAADRTVVVGMYTKVTLVPGTLLTQDQLTTEIVPGPGKHLVSVSLKAEARPARTLQPGDRLLLVTTPDPRAAAAERPQPLAPPPTFDATVHKVGAPAPNGDIVVDVVVAQTDGPTVAALAAAGRIVPVVTAGG